MKSEHFLSILLIVSLECVGQMARELPLYSTPTGENPNDYRDDRKPIDENRRYINTFEN